MKLILFITVFMFPLQSLWAYQIFHLDQKTSVCEWKIYDVKKDKDRKYFKTTKCPDQVVWLKDKTFYYSLGKNIYWADPSSKKAFFVTNIKAARKGHDPTSEIIWGVKGKHNSLYAMVIDPNIKHMRVNRVDSYEYRGASIDPDSFTGVGNEHKAAGIIKVWLKGKQKWKKKSLKLVGKYNNRSFDEALYNNSVLSSRQIVNYNECSGTNCENLPSDGFWDKKRFEKKLKVMDNGIESIGYLKLNEEKGLLFKKALDDTLHPVKPFILCEDNCETMTEVDLPKSFSNSYAMAKKGKHFLITNDNRGSIASLYRFDSPKPVKQFKGPMVFWHPF